MYFLRYLRVSRSMVFLAVGCVCHPLNRYGCSKAVSSFTSWVRFLVGSSVCSRVRSMAYCRSVKASWFWRFCSCWVSLTIWAASL